MTSMMDMFTLILVFLLNFLDPDAAPETDVALPTTRSTAPVGTGPTLTVTPQDIRVGDERVVTLDSSGGAPALPASVPRTGRRIDVLYERLQRAAESSTPATVTPVKDEKGGSEPLLVVQCDKGVPFSLLGDVLYTAGQAGFGQFRFAAVSDPE
jgi:biopolymer transport protein ExbD